VNEAPTSYPPAAVAPPTWKRWEHTSSATGRRMTARSPLHYFHAEYGDARRSWSNDRSWTQGYALGLLHGHAIGREAALKETNR
jgi:hypothetical protein